MRKMNSRLLMVMLLFSMLFLSACRLDKGVESFTYKGILFEGFDPGKHFPSPEFTRGLEWDKILLSRKDVGSLKKTVDLLEDKGLLYLLQIPRKFVVVNCPYSFADKPQRTVYIDKEKINLDYSVADDWEFKMIRFTPRLIYSGKSFSLRGNPPLPNLLRIIIHEVGHLIEYEVLEFSWKGEFVVNELNRDFVSVSWDEANNWRDREEILFRLAHLENMEELVDFLSWFTGKSSYFSLYSSTGMNEDFAESFAFYYFITYFDYSLQFFWKDKLFLPDITRLNEKREKKLKFIGAVMEGEPGKIPLWRRKISLREGDGGLGV